MAKAKAKPKPSTKREITLDEITLRIEKAKLLGKSSIQIQEDIPFDLYMKLLQLKINVYQRQVGETSNYYYVISF